VFIGAEKDYFISGRDKVHQVEENYFTQNPVDNPPRPPPPPPPQKKKSATKSTSPLI